MRPVLPLIATLMLVAACEGQPNVRISSTKTDEEPKGVLKVVDALQCPQTLGVLARKGSAQSGGRVCIYAGPKGAEVTLHLVRLGDSTPDAALKEFERLLTGDLPHTAAQFSAEAAQAAGADAAAQGADVQVDAAEDTARIRFPGMSIDAKGEKASVRIGGISIKADDGSGRVDVTSGDDSVNIRAQDDAAEVRTRAAGDATRTTWILTDSRPSEAGWRLVGYEARGPIGGPIVVATVRSKERERDRVFDAAKDLVTLNVGE
jgi:hypothetical protein